MKWMFVAVFVMAIVLCSCITYTMNSKRQVDGLEKELRELRLELHETRKELHEDHADLMDVVVKGNEMTAKTYEAVDENRKMLEFLTNIVKNQNPDLQK